MSTLLRVLAVLSLVALVGKLHYGESGALTIAYPPWLVETTPAALLLTLLVLIATYRFVCKAFALLFSLIGVGQNNQDKRTGRALLKGVLEWSEGRWRSAEKTLVNRKSRRDPYTAFANLLLAARAARDQGHVETCHRYLDRAEAIAPANSTAVSVLRVETHIEQNALPQALDLLLSLHAAHPNQGHIIRLLATVYQRQQNWPKLQALLPKLRRRRLLQDDSLAAMELTCHRGMLGQIDCEGLLNYWQRLPRTVRRSDQLVGVLVERLIQRGQQDEAEKILRQHLNKHWNQALAKQYASIEIAHSSKQLSYAESWLAEHGRDPALLFALGRLCLRCQLWGKARAYLESSLSIQNSVEGALLLGDLLMQLGDKESARSHYAHGLKAAPSQSMTLLSNNAEPSDNRPAEDEDSAAHLTAVNRAASQL